MKSESRSAAFCASALWALMVTPAEVLPSQSSFSASLAYSLRGPVEGADLDRSGAIARSSSGQFILSADNGTRLALFDSTGRAIRLVGRAGDGPGEFRRISSVSFGAGDTLLVVEASRRLVHILSPSLAFVRRVALPVATNEVVLLESGSLVVGGMVRLSPTSGVALHLVTARGLVTSLDTISLDGPGIPASSRRIVGKGDQNHFWTAPINELRFREWSVTGRVLREVPVPATWFAPSRAEPEQPFDMARPQHRISDVSVSGSIATILISIPAESWAPPSSPLTASNTPMSRIPLSYIDQFLDSRVVLIDLQRRQVIASGTQTKRFTKLLGPRSAVSIEEDSDGLIEYRIWVLKRV